MGTFTARTAAAIATAMQADKDSRSALDTITSTSAAGVWENLKLSFATAANLHENAFVAFADEVEARALEIPVGIARWYAAESLLFQYGDALEYIDGNIVYPVIDEDKQIIKLAAADKENGFLVLKVAALNPDGTARPLTALELTSFMAYWHNKEFACVPLSFISQPADIARITYRIGIDATVLDPATGQSLSDPTIYPVEEAIVSYLLRYQGDRFNGTFRIADLTDVIQAVTGVRNPIAEDIQIKEITGPFLDVIADVNDEYKSRAGYIIADTTAGFTLRDLITYYNA
jgi:hypothetical protein